MHWGCVINLVCVWHTAMVHGACLYCRSKCWWHRLGGIDHFQSFPSKIVAVHAAPYRITLGEVRRLTLRANLHLSAGFILFIVLADLLGFPRIPFVARERCIFKKIIKTHFAYLAFVLAFLFNKIAFLRLQTSFNSNFIFIESSPCLLSI